MKRFFGVFFQVFRLAKKKTYLGKSREYFLEQKVETENGSSPTEKNLISNRKVGKSEMKIWTQFLAFSSTKNTNFGEIKKNLLLDRKVGKNELKSFLAKKQKKQEKHPNFTNYEKT